MKNKYLTMKERVSFTIGAFGRSGIYTLMSMFYMVFLIDVAKVGSTTATAIILGGKVFDAINDPIMGMIVDKTHSKWGKMRPYLLFAPIPIAISTILMFIAPFSGTTQHTAAVVWATITYILWGVCFTIQDVPFWGLSAVITPLENERTSFLSTARLGSTFGGILPALLIPMLRTSSLGLRKGYLIGAIAFAVLGTVLSSIIFFVSKERVEKSDRTPSFKETFHVVGKNRLLIIVIAAAVLGSTMVTANSCADYIANYLVIQGKTDWGILQQTNDVVKSYSYFIPRGTVLTTLTVAIGVGMVPAMALFPLLHKKFSLKQIYIGSSVFGIISHLVCFFVFRGDISNINIIILWVCLFFMGFPLGIYNVITYAFIADSVDYLEWKTGERHEGVCFSFQTFLSKVTSGIATAIAGRILTYAKYVEPSESALDVNGKQILAMQSDKTLMWMLIMVTVIPAIGFALTIIPMLFNDYTGKKKENAQKELAKMREERAKEKVIE